MEFLFMVEFDKKIQVLDDPNIRLNKETLPKILFWRVIICFLEPLIYLQVIITFLSDKLTTTDSVSA